MLSPEAFFKPRTAEPPAKRVQRPPKLPGGSILSGHLRELASDNLALFERCARHNGIVRFRVYWYQCHIVTDAEIAGAMLVTEASAFKKTRALQVARPTFGNGLVTSEGDVWRRQQRSLRPFLTPHAAASHAELLQEVIDRKLASWSPGQVVDLHEHMVDVSLEFVCRALFGLDAGRLQPLIRDAADAVQEWHSHCQALCLPYPHYYPTLANYRYRMKTRALNRAVYAVIHEARARGPRDEGLLGALLEVRDEDGAAISDEEVRDQLVTLFLAGHDTTATSLALALYELSYRPDLQQTIARESTETEDSPCLERVLKETLRLYPAVHLVARTAVRDVHIGGYLVRRGEEVVLPLSVFHRSPRSLPDPTTSYPSVGTRTRAPRASRATLIFHSVRALACASGKRSRWPNCAASSLTSSAASAYNRWLHAHLGWKIA